MQSILIVILSKIFGLGFSVASAVMSLLMKSGAVPYWLGNVLNLLAINTTLIGSCTAQ